MSESQWNYHKAFCRNLGLVSPEEQEQLRQSRVAIAGMGGVGGVHLMTLVRAGISRFTIADYDRFDYSNFNRQYGAFCHTVGRPKTEAMIEFAKAVNPEVDIRVFNEAITQKNCSDFLKDVDCLLDGIDAFEIDARRIIYRQAANLGIYVVTAGPIGFSTPWLVFSPQGMPFDQYFGFRDGQTLMDQFICFLVGLSPAATHIKYIDKTRVDMNEKRGPSLGLACQLASGVAAAEVIKILLKRGPLHVVPGYQQFDAYRGLYKKGRVWWGSQNPLQQLKRFIVRRMLTNAGVQLSAKTT